MANKVGNLMGCMIHRRWYHIYTPAAALVLPPKTAIPHLSPSFFWCFNGACGRSQEEDVVELVSTIAGRFCLKEIVLRTRLDHRASVNYRLLQQHPCFCLRPKLRSS